SDVFVRYPPILIYVFREFIIWLQTYDYNMKEKIAIHGTSNSQISLPSVAFKSIFTPIMNGHLFMLQQHFITEVYHLEGCCMNFLA
ncbi:hypothetical protein ACJX0J_026658, partial [Zea mays]